MTSNDFLKVYVRPPSGLVGGEVNFFPETESFFVTVFKTLQAPEGVDVDEAGVEWPYFFIDFVTMGKLRKLKELLFHAEQHVNS